VAGFELDAAQKIDIAVDNIRPALDKRLGLVGT